MNFKIFDVNEKDGKITVDSKNWGIGIVKIGELYIMVQQVRYGVGEEVVEFPCGNIELGETTLNGIIREIEEETGYEVVDNTKEVQFLYCNSPNPAFMTNKMSAYFIELRDDIKIGQHLDESENIKVKLLTAEEVEEEMDKPTTSVMMRLAWEIYIGKKVAQTANKLS